MRRHMSLYAHAPPEREREGNLMHLRLPPLLQHLPQSHNTILPARGQVSPRLIEISSPDHAIMRLHLLLKYDRSSQKQARARMERS